MKNNINIKFIGDTFMVNNEYAIAYKEVLEILKYIPEEDFNKIHNDTIEMFKTYSDKKYIFSYDPSKTLDEQNVSKRAKAIIGILFRDYWATEVQREKIIRKQKNDRLILEEQKKSLYDIENIFKKRNICSETEAKEEITEMVVYKANFITRVFNKIKKFLKIK